MFQAQVRNGAPPRVFEKYTIPKALQPKNAETTSPTEPSPDQTSQILNLQRSVDSLKSALADSEASLAASIEHCDDTKQTLESALETAQKEIEVLKLYYDEEVSRLSGLLSASSKKMDMQSDQLCELKTHFVTSKDYKDWRAAVSAEAFSSLPDKLAKASDILKSCTDQEIAVMIEVLSCVVLHFVIAVCAGCGEAELP